MKNAKKLHNLGDRRMTKRSTRTLEVRLPAPLRAHVRPCAFSVFSHAPSLFAARLQDADVTKQAKEAARKRIRGESSSEGVVDKPAPKVVRPTPAPE
eukprot:4042947-Pleurochrysis_carterae.AAC.1